MALDATVPQNYLPETLLWGIRPPSLRIARDSQLTQDQHC